MEPRWHPTVIAAILYDGRDRHAIDLEMESPIPSEVRHSLHNQTTRRGTPLPNRADGNCAKARIRRTLLTKLCLGFMPHIMPRTGFWPVRRRSPRDHSLCIAFRGVVMHWLHQSTQKAYQDVVANELSHFASSKVPAPAKFGTLERLNPNKSAAKSGYHPATGNAGNLCARASLMAGCMETEIRFRRPFPER